MDQITLELASEPLLDDVAVVVPVFNRRSLIVKTLDSVLAQSSLPGQLIIIDDGSTDGSGLVIKAWMARQDSPCKIHFRTQANRGVSAARNTGFELAGQISYVAFLDSDDVWPLDFLARTQAALSAIDGAVAASCDRKFAGDGRPAEECNLKAISTRWILVHGAGIGSLTLLRAAAVRACGRYDESIRSGADLKLFLEISLTGSWIHVSGDPVTMLRGANLHGADAGNLSLSHPANWVTWATIVSQFLARNGTRSGLTGDEIAKLVTSKWHVAAKSLVNAGMTRAACEAYEHALSPLAYMQSLAQAKPGG
jgi:glycosyltransferase involved in cell wall biosynthesis